MFHYFNSIQNTKGDALIGYYVKLRDSNGDTADIFADENSTPIISVSEVANAAKVDSDGNVDFYVASGTYTLDIYATNATTLVKSIADVPMIDVGAIDNLTDGDKGDITVSNSFATWSINNNAVTNGKIRQSSGLSVIGRSANSTGDVADITGTDGQVLRVSGTTLGFGTIASAGIADGAVTYAKMQDISATSRVLGRITSGAGDVEELSAANLKTILGLAQSDISGLTTADSPQFTAINIGHASDTTIARSGAGDITIEGNAVYRAGGTDVPLADGGTGASLADPGGDRIMFWDDSASQVTWLQLGTNLSITGTTLDASGSGGIADGDYGDIVVSVSGAAWTIDDQAVSYAKMQWIASPSKLLGRITSGAGPIEELTGDNVRTITGLATSDSPQFTAINLGHASDTTISRTGAGDIAIEGNAVYRAGGTDVPVADGGTGASTASGARTNLAAAAQSQTAECISGFIASPSDKDYRLVVKIPHAGTITETVTRSASGTCTATFKVNTTALGGTANSVSSTEQAQSHASTNTFAADDDIVLTVSSNSSCADMSFTIKYTRTLA